MFSRREKNLLLLMATVQFSHIVDFMLVMPLAPQFMRVFAIRPDQFSLLVSCYTLAAGISGLLTSLFIDRFGRKAGLLFFYSGFAVGTLCCAFAPSYGWLLFSRSLAGAFGGVMNSLIYSIISDSIANERRGAAMGAVMSAFAVASVFGVPFSLLLANHFNWHMPFLVLGIFALLVCVIIFLVLPPMKGHLKGPHEGNTPFLVIRHILQSPQQLFAFVFMFCLVLGQFSIIPFISPSFVYNAGLAEKHLPLVYLFGGLVSMVASPVFGRMADKYGRVVVFYIGAGLSLLPIFAITRLTVTPLPWLILLSCSFFLVMSGRMVPAMAIVSSAATPRYRASFMSVLTSVQQLSAALASYIAGSMIVSGADGRLKNFSSVGYIAMAFSLLAMLFVGRVKSVEGN